ncbi:MAG: FAD-binding oxidoreductase [Alphaproteobacteria bacterium]|nr:FAD-binding oxidoreductase [Alphaproteobacteria bacterium]
MDQDSFDVIVVGGGIVGTAAAYFLVRRGASVALVERDRIGQGTTARSFAWINASSKVADEPYHRLNALGAGLYKELGSTFGDSRLGLHRTGMLQCISRSDAAGHAAMMEQADYLTRYGYPHSVIDAAALAELEPHITFDDEVTAIHAMSEDWLDAPQCTRVLADEVRNLGSIVLEQCAAQELTMSDYGAISGLVTQHGMFSAPRVLIAAGHETPEVLAQLTGYEAFSARFPMNRVPGLLVTTPDNDRTRNLHHVIYFDSPAGAFHIRPAPNGGLRMGADDTDGMIAEDASAGRMQEAAARLLSYARARVPELIGDITAEQCELALGIRPYPHDGKTLAGPLPGSEGLYLIATHSGITLAPALGTLMAELIIEGSTSDALRPFSLDRFPGFS